MNGPSLAWTAKRIGGDSEETGLITFLVCGAERACIFNPEDQVEPECRFYSETPCNCSESDTGCDPYDNTKIYICEGAKIRSDTCPTGQVCTGNGYCTEPSQSGGEDSGLGRQDLGSGGTNSGTTKPATCSADNANTRYPHETDCKKYYQCLDVPLAAYLYVESTCLGSLVYNKVTTYCDEPENVPDCPQ